MDSSHFDSLTRHFASANSRRGLFRVLVAGLSGVAFPIFSPRLARAINPCTGVTCEEGEICCDGQCVTSPGTDQDCGCSHEVCGECRTCDPQANFCVPHAGPCMENHGFLCREAGVCSDGSCLLPRKPNYAPCGNGGTCYGDECTYPPVYTPGQSPVPAPPSSPPADAPKPKKKRRKKGRKKRGK
jgi:hypothetical protein